MATKATPETITVKPAEGRKVYWPDGRPFDPDGDAVPADDPYWIRRLNDEDVVPAKLTAKKEA
ncbi:MAG: DUF2635 domain-containing protein [Caulobacter sp.]|nr:DUF2635 domain-containing protein [Caulobacter sp.]